MHRRQALKQITIATGGLIILPAWMSSCGYGDKQSHQSSFSPEQQEVLAAVTDTIIPAGTTVGALAVGTDKFLQKLIDDCYEKPVQDIVKNQLASLQKNGFQKAAREQREQMLLKLSVSTNKDEKNFFDLIKKETIRGYTTSQKVMEELLGYKVAPGYYHGCVNANS